MMSEEADDETPDTLQGGQRIDDSKIKQPPDKRGGAPKGEDGKPVEINHREQKKGNKSPFDEMTREDHRGKGNYKKNHPNTGQEPSTVDRKEFRKLREQHWKGEWDRGRWDKWSGDK